MPGSLPGSCRKDVESELEVVSLFLFVCFLVAASPLPLLSPPAIQGGGDHLYFSSLSKLGSWTLGATSTPWYL